MKFPLALRERTRRLRYPKLPISPGLAAWLSRGFFLAGPLVSYVLVELLNNNDPWGFSNLQLALNLVWYYMGAVFFYFVWGNRDRATRWAMVLAWVIGIINSYAFRFRGRTLFPSDIVTIRTALNVAGNYNYLPDLTQLFTLLVMALFLAALALLPTPKERQPFSWKLFVPSQAACFAFLWMFFCTNTVSDAGISPSMWTTRGNGLALNFSLCVRYSWVQPPSGYSTTAVNALAEEYPSDAAAVETSGSTTKPVNLIVIMNESFSDLSVLPGVETNRDAMPFLRSLEENTIKGYAYSSVFGGTTANSEYEFLTGNTTAFLPAGTVPYHMYISSKEPGLARQMGDLGYYTVAMHPYYSSGWNRVAVYNDMGFDEKHFLEDFTYDEEEDIIREYLSDQANYENLIARYEAKEEGQPLFLFNVTMQNHSGYTGEWTNLPREVWLTGDMEGKYDTVDQYLSLIYQSDQAFEYLIDYFSQVEEPTMICLFGDHQPQVDGDFYTETLGEEVDFLAPDVAQKKQMVPFLIWANYDIPERERVSLSLNYLSAYLTEVAGLPQTGYQQYLKALWQELPIVNTVGYADSQGNWVHTSAEEDLSPTAQSALSEYKRVLYNNIFDKGKRPSDFFTLASP